MVASQSLGTVGQTDGSSEDFQSKVGHCYFVTIQLAAKCVDIVSFMRLTLRVYIWRVAF